MAKQKKDEKVLKVDLNSANAGDIARVTGISSKRAQEIVEHRQNNGSFKNWEDFKKIPGFSTDLVNSLKQNGVLH